MTSVPCNRDDQLRQKIEELAEVLKTEAHTLVGDDITEQDFYNSGLFRGAIERLRGQYSATMRLKREFMRHVLNYLQDRGLIKDWIPSGGKNRFDYTIELNSGRISGVELKGCLDGNNTNIFDRPPQASEFLIWSVCTNQGADPQKNVWSGIHTRLGAEIIDRESVVDGMVVWDMVCSTLGRPCPKVIANPARLTQVGPYSLPPPCLYLFPGTISSPKNNPKPAAQSLGAVELVSILNNAFGGQPEEVFQVSFETRYQGVELQRLTRVERAGVLQQQSGWTSMRRS